MTKKEEFLSLCDKYIKRDGIKELLEWLESTDFFEAPASTRFHGAEEGGLVEHSLCVFRELTRLLKAYPEIKTTGETAVIVALFHDVCKVSSYRKDFRNQKNAEGKWEKVSCYAFEEELPFGNHGGKSVFLIMRHMNLSLEEAVVIQNHMGNTDGKYACSEAYKKYPLAWVLHVADEAATYLFDK